MKFFLLVLFALVGASYALKKSDNDPAQGIDYSELLPKNLDVLFDRLEVIVPGMKKLQVLLLKASTIVLPIFKVGL